MVEAALERACIQDERAGAVSRGLSNSPTSRTSRQSSRVEAESAALRRGLKATAPGDRLRARLALMRRSVGIAARAHEAGRAVPGHRPGVVKFVTLTYAPGSEWKPDHISRCVQHLRMWCARRLGSAARYVWVAELQERRAARSGELAAEVVHYHMAVWLPHGERLPYFDAAGWWPHGSTQVDEARDGVAYLMKYLSKGTRLAFPHGMRTHGAGGLEYAMRRAKRWLRYPSWIKARADIHDDWRPAKGGGWYSPEGFCIPSEHVRQWVGDRWCCVQVADYGRPFKAEGPFSWVR